MLENGQILSEKDVILKVVPNQFYNELELEANQALKESKSETCQKLIEKWYITDQELHVFSFEVLGLSLWDLRQPERLSMDHGGYPYIRFNKFTIECVLQIGIQITKGLKDLHELGFLHSNILPSNILTAYEIFEEGQIEKIEYLKKNVFLTDLSKV